MGMISICAQPLLLHYHECMQCDRSLYRVAHVQRSCMLCVTSCRTWSKYASIEKDKTVLTIPSPAPSRHVLKGARRKKYLRHCTSPTGFKWGTPRLEVMFPTKRALTLAMSLPVIHFRDVQIHVTSIRVRVTSSICAYFYLVMLLHDV